MIGSEDEVVNDENNSFYDSDDTAFSWLFALL